MKLLASEVITALITFVMSVSVSAFVSGVRWGKMQADVENIKDDLKEIKGMFTLKLRE